MSLFDFPRIHIAGTLTLSPGTANNCDYAGNAFLPDGQTLGLIDSTNVMPITFGMNDADFISWVQQVQTFTPNTQQIVPSEWNYYGDMSSSGTAAVIGVAVAPGKVLTAPDPSIPVSALIGSALTTGGSITDVNSQGSPPATQFFIEQLTLMNGSATALQGPASKGACQWLNIYRNVNAQADQGAGGYIYQVVLKSQSSVFNIPGFEDPAIVGAIFRYYLYNIMVPDTTNEEIVYLYQQQEQNPAPLQFVATIAPLYEDEAIITSPIGRLLVASSATIKTPTANNNGGGTIALAPAVVQQNGDTISAEFVGTFPDNFQQPGGPGTPWTNDKFGFGAVALTVSGNGTTATIGSVNYTDMNGGNACGWLFDFDISNNAEAQKALADPNASFALNGGSMGDLLTEAEYFIVTNQLAIYGEQFGPGDSFVNQGAPEPARVSVYSRGVELTGATCPPMSVWSYATVPLQTPGPAVLVTNSFAPGEALRVDTSQAGNFNFVFTIGDQQPPSSWSAFILTLLMTNTTTISLRLLPNGVDFSQYYVDPNAPDPVGNASLTFDVVYANVLRTYYLLFPAMNKFIQLNSEGDVAAAAPDILKVTDPSRWMSIHYMPRTRDLSQSRRTLLQAWCRNPH